MDFIAAVAFTKNVLFMNIPNDVGLFFTLALKWAVWQQQTLMLQWQK